MLNKDLIKESLSIEQVSDLVAELGGEPMQQGDKLICKTICHCGQSHKLYYYENTKLFRCYTDCGDAAFDIFDLVLRNKNAQGETINGKAWELYNGVSYVADYFGFSHSFFNFNEQKQLADWEIFKKYERISQSENKQSLVQLKQYDKNILQHYPQPIFSDWESEGINPEIVRRRNICYNPSEHEILIPHYDINNNLIGIRARTLIKDKEKYGKYRPAVLNGTMYNHPLGFNLYNINNSKRAIRTMKKAIVFEGEKSPLLYASYFGDSNDISVACCGSSLVSYQIHLLLSLGVEEIIIAFDKQFKEIGDKEWQRWVNKLMGFHLKYGSYVQISYMFDKDNNLLGYKDAPIDQGAEVFTKLFKERIML